MRQELDWTKKTNKALNIMSNYIVIETLALGELESVSDLINHKKMILKPLLDQAVA